MTAMTQSMKIGFVGLGAMGVGMAARLIAAGHDVALWNRSPERAAPLLAIGARFASSPADAAVGAAVVVTMLADDQAVEAVVHGPDGLIAGLDAGAMHLSMSTIGPDCAVALTAAHADAGQVYVAAPVFGRPDAAAKGALFIVAAGPMAAIAQADPLFAALGQRHFAVGDTPSQANIVKLIGNFMILAATEAMGEAMAIAGEAGVPSQTMLAVLTGTLFDAPIYRNYGAMLVEQRFRPAGFTAELGLKDMRLLDKAADRLRVAAPFLSTLRDRLRTLIARHGPDIDWAATGQLAREDSPSRTFHHQISIDKDKS